MYILINENSINILYANENQFCLRYYARPLDPAHALCAQYLSVLPNARYTVHAPPLPAPHIPQFRFYTLELTLRGVGSRRRHFQIEAVIFVISF